MARFNTFTSHRCNRLVLFILVASGCRPTAPSSALPGFDSDALPCRFDRDVDTINEYLDEDMLARTLQVMDGERIRPAIAEMDGVLVTDVTIHGNERIPTSMIRQVLRSRVGEPLSRYTIQGDVRRIWRLEVFADVRVMTNRDGQRLALEFHVIERPRFGRVYIVGVEPEMPGRRRLQRLTGGVYDPVRLHRTQQHLTRQYMRAGHFLAEVVVATMSEANGAIAVCVRVSPDRIFKLLPAGFVGNRALDDKMLRGQLTTETSSTSLGRIRLHADPLPGERTALETLYYEHGYLDVQIGRAKLKLDRQRDTAQVMIHIHEGIRYRLGTLMVSGDVIGGDPTVAARYRVLLPVRSGDVFKRSVLVAWIRDVQALARESGYPYASIEPMTEQDKQRGVVNVNLVLRSTGERSP